MNNLNEQLNRSKELMGILNEQDSEPTEKDREELINCLKTYKIDSSNYNQAVSRTEKSIKQNQETYSGGTLNVHAMWMVKMLGDLTIDADWSGGKPEWLDNLSNHVWCDGSKKGQRRKAEREQSCIYKIISRFPQVIKSFEQMC